MCVTLHFVCMKVLIRYFIDITSNDEMTDFGSMVTFSAIRALCERNKIDEKYGFALSEFVCAPELAHIVLTHRLTIQPSELPIDM